MLSLKIFLFFKYWVDILCYFLREVVNHDKPCSPFWLCPTIPGLLNILRRMSIYKVLILTKQHLHIRLIHTFKHTLRNLIEWNIGRRNCKPLDDVNSMLLTRCRTSDRHSSRNKQITYNERQAVIRWAFLESANCAGTGDEKSSICNKLRVTVC